MEMVRTHKVSSTEGERADFPSLGNRFLLRGEDVDRRFALVEHTIRPRALAAPLHTHEHEDEYSFVLSGRIGAQIGDEVLEAEAGDLVLKPRGVPHAFWNASEEETRVLEIISPAGFEQYFAELAPELSVDGPPNVEALAEIRERYGLTMDVTSIGRLIEEHELRP